MAGKEEKVLAQKFRAFREANPFDFLEEQLEKIEADIQKPRNGTVSDEYVDFILWTKGLKPRQEYFAEYVEKILPLEKYQELLDVGCGRTAGLSKLLAAKGYRMTAMDPQIIPESVITSDINCIKDEFAFEKTDITKYDAIVAQEPCDATEHIIRECVANRKNFVISLCGAPHRLLSGKMPQDVFVWYHYLEEIGGKNCVLIDPQMIPGYSTYMMIGIFLEERD